MTNGAQEPPKPSAAQPPQSAQASMPKKPMGKAKRRVRNFILQPLLQVKLGLYAILLSILFAVALGAILYFNFHDLVNAVRVLTDAQDEVDDLFDQYFHHALPWLIACGAIYIF